VRNGRSKSSEVIDFGTNRKRVCNFLLVINSNFGPIFPLFEDIAGFFLEERPHQIWGVPLADVVAPRSKDPKLIIRVITFELTQPYINVTDGQTDGRTDGLL